MQSFQVYFVTSKDHIEGREPIWADTRAEAIRIGFDALRHWKDALPTRRAAAIEIWCQGSRIFSGKPVRGYVAPRSVSPDDCHKHWLARAEEARVISEQMTDKIARRTLHQIAAGYEAIAARAGKPVTAGQAHHPNH